jgi:hypothetical protein
MQTNDNSKTDNPTFNDILLLKIYFVITSQVEDDPKLKRHFFSDETYEREYISIIKLRCFSQLIEAIFQWSTIRIYLVIHKTM